MLCPPGPGRECRRRRCRQRGAAPSPGRIGRESDVLRAVPLRSVVPSPASPGNLLEMRMPRTLAEPPEPETDPAVRAVHQPGHTKPGEPLAASGIPPFAPHFHPFESRQLSVKAGAVLPLL